MRPAGLFLSSGSRALVSATWAKKLVSKTLCSRSTGTSAAECSGPVPGKVPRGDAGVVDQDVEAAVLRVEVVVGGLVVGGAGDVELEYVGIDAGGAKFGNGFFALLRVARADDDFCVGGLQFEGSLEAEAAVSTGDESNFLRHWEVLLCELWIQEAGKGAGIAGWVRSGEFWHGMDCRDVRAARYCANQVVFEPCAFLIPRKRMQRPADRAAGRVRSHWPRWRTCSKSLPTRFLSRTRRA